MTCEECEKLKTRNEYLEGVIEGLRDNFKNTMVEVEELRDQIKRQGIKKHS